MDYAKLKTRVEQNESRDIEERTANARKFTELYASRNQTNETLKELTTTLKFLTQNIDVQFRNLEIKVDALKGEH